MSETFADKLFNDLNSLKNNSYKLSNDDITIEGTPKQETITADIYGLNYKIGSSSAFTVGEKVADLDMTLKTEEQTLSDQKDFIKLDVNDSKITGGYNGVSESITTLPKLTSWDYGGSYSPTEYTQIEIRCKDNSNYFQSILTLNMDDDGSNKTVDIDIDYFNLLPVSEPSSGNGVYVAYVNSSVPSSTEASSFGVITIKNSDESVIFKFKLTVVGEGESTVCYPDKDSVEGGVLPHKIDCWFHHGLNIYYYYDSTYYDTPIELKNNDIKYKDTTYSIPTESGAFDFENDTKTIRIYGTRTNNNTYNCNIEDVYLNYVIYLVYNNGLSSLGVRPFVYKQYKEAECVLNLTAHDVSQPYPALFIISSDLNKNETYEGELNKAIGSINTTVLNDGIIYTIPRFEQVK